jgi:hypothetical protein
MKIIQARDEAPPELEDEESEFLGKGFGRKIRVYFKKAEGVGAALRIFGREPRADGVKYFPEGRAIMIHFASGQNKTYFVDGIEELEHLSDEELATIRVSFAGKALTIEERDVDISIAGLLRDKAASGGGGRSGDDYEGEVVRIIN